MRFLLSTFSCLSVLMTAPSIIAQQNLPAMPTGEHTVPLCVVTLIDDTLVPAEKAGTLIAVEASLGFEVKRDGMLAQINEIEAQMQKRVAQLEWEVANEEAESKVELEYQEKAKAVSQATYEEAKKANQLFDRALSQFEVRRRTLEYERSILAIERTHETMKVAKLQRNLAEAKVEAADHEIKSRRVVAPFDGIVAEVFKKRGEWVAPGEPILRLVGLDRLRVKGFVSASEFAQVDVVGRPVTIEVKKAHGEVARFESTIKFASPLVEDSGQFLVAAEFDNRRDRVGFHEVNAGQEAEMTIHFGRSPQSISRRP